MRPAPRTTARPDVPAAAGRPAFPLHLRRIGLAAAALLPAALSLNLTACLTDDMDNVSSDTTQVIDPFPNVKGSLIIPIQKDFRSDFLYAEFDSAGTAVTRRDTLTLHVTRREANLWTYAFEDSGHGYLIRYVDSPNRDSAGIWIAGTFQGPINRLDSVPTRWLPNDPDTGKSWPVGRGRRMHLEEKEAVYYTEAIPAGDTLGAPVSQGFQRHTAFKFREIAGDTVTIYHFKRGLGCLGFERSAKGRLMAMGTLRAFHRP